MPNDVTPPNGDGFDSGAGAFDEFLARYLAGERARAERSIDLSALPERAHAGASCSARDASRSSAASASSTPCTFCA